MVKDYKKMSEIRKGLFLHPPQLTPNQKDELVGRIRAASEEMRNPVLKQAYNQGILTPEEYETKYQGHFYDDYACDSFIQYLNAVMNSDSQYFLTQNERMLKRRDELASRFGLKIAAIEEISALVKSREKE